MSDKAITRRLKIYINGEEVDATLSNLRKSLVKFKAQANRAVEGSEEWKKYNAEVARLEGELSQATAAQKKFREETGFASAKISESTKEITKFTSSFSNLFQGLQTGDFLQVQEGFEGIKSGIAGAAKAGLAFIATPIGATIAALVGIGAAAKAWYNYNSQVVEALKVTTGITQLTDGAADKARINAETLNEVYGVEFEKTLETAKKLVTQFGISYDDAFNVIEDGLKRGQANNDEYFESLNEYGAFFKAAGYSVQEFKDIVSAGYDLGIYKDKLPDALKEADLAIKEQTKTTRDALVNAFGAAFTEDILKRVRTGEITTKQALEEIAKQSEKTGLNVQQNAQLTADLFKGAGEDAGGALKVFEAVNVALNAQKKPLTESQQLLADQAEATRQLKNVSSQLFATGDKGFGLLIDKGKLFGTKILIKILEAGINVYNWFIDLNNESGLFSAILTGAGKAATTSFSLISEGVSLIWNQFKSLGKLVDGIFTFNPTKIKQAFSEGFSNIGNSFKNLKKLATDGASDIYNAFKGNNKKERLSLKDFSAESTTNTENSTNFSSTDNPNTPSNKKGKSDAEKTAEEEANTENSTNFSSTDNPNTPSNKKGKSDAEKTAEEEAAKIIEQKKKVAEYLKQFEEDQELQIAIKDLEKDEAAQLKEELELENRYAKLEEEANGEAQLLADLEEAKNIELDAIKEKWNTKFWQDNKKYKDKIAEDDKKFKEEQLKAEQTLQDAKNDMISTGLGILKSFAKEGSEEYKALFLLEKLAATANVIVSGIAERAKIAEVWAGVPAVSGPLLLASKIRTGTSLATIAATTIKGLDKGGYTFNGPNTGGVDGIGGKLARIHPGEYMIPQPVMRMPEVPQIVSYLEAKRTGKNVETSTVNSTVSNNNSNDVLLMVASVVGKLNQQIEDGLKINYTLHDEKERKLLEQKLNDTINASKK